MEEVIVIYMQCEKCEEKRCHVKENREQGVIQNRKRWYRYQIKEERKVAYPIEGKVQQISA